MAKSVYSLIIDNLKDGSLPENFSIGNYFKEDGEVGFADGALDGLTYFKIGLRTPNAKLFKLIAKGIDAIEKGDCVAAEKIFSKFPKEQSVFGYSGVIQDYVVNNKKAIPPENIYNAATYMIYNSSSIKCVQMALTIIELIRISGDESENIKTAIRRLGLCEEFSTYAMSNMCRGEWENANEEVFALVKKLHGWGKIFEVDYLMPETDEIKNWYFYEGMENNISNAYTALDCWEKSGAEDILFGMPSRKEYDRISAMLDGMMNDDIWYGLAYYANTGKILPRFLELSKKFAMSEANRKTVYKIMEWTAEKHDFDEKDEIMSLCSELLGSDMPMTSFLQ